MIAAFETKMKVRTHNSLVCVYYDTRLPHSTRTKCKMGEPTMTGSGVIEVVVSLKIIKERYRAARLRHLVCSF